MSQQATEPVAAIAGKAVPEALTEFDIWTVWNGEEKTPLAPWATGDMYRAGWGDGVVADPDSRMTERPETDYQTARQVARIEPDVLHESYPFPRMDNGLPDLPLLLMPTIILPHYPPDPPIMLVDFDDVRDPLTGEITAEVQAILDRLDAFVEVSTSGEGLHAFVRAELPGQLGKFIADLDDLGAIEMYDHGRFVGCTWRHVEGTPLTVPERQDVIDDLVEQYETETLRKRRERTPPDRVETAVAALRGGSSSDDRNPYFELDIRNVADRGYFGQYRSRAPGDEWTGPHPGHGPEHSDPDDCTNFGIEPSANVWHCFACDSGAGPLHLIGVLEGAVQCVEADDLTNQPEALLRACLAARDEYSSSLDDADPPYKALVGVAKLFDLQMADPQEGRLGKDCWKIARQVYDELSAGDL